MHYSLNVMCRTKFFSIFTAFIFICAAGFLTGCESTKNASAEKAGSSRKSENTPTVFAPVTEEKLAGGWILFTMDDGTESYPVSADTTFFYADGLIHGCGGINSYSADCTIKGTEIVIGEIASTKMAGPTEDMESEDNFFRLLSSCNTISIDYKEDYEELYISTPKLHINLIFTRN